jgi:hypothetical protein
LGLLAPQNIGYLHRGPFAPARRLDATSGQRPRHTTKGLNTAGLYLVNDGHDIGSKPVSGRSICRKGPLSRLA